MTSVNFWESKSDSDVEILKKLLKANNLPLWSEDHLSRRAAVYRYYQLGFNEIGIPGRMRENQYIEHPIYGTYLLYEYFLEYINTKSSIMKNTMLSTKRYIILVQMDMING